MKILTITPTRGDRPDFLHRCREQMERQTVFNDHFIVDFEPKNDGNDISKRIYAGFNRFQKENYDLAFIIEDDDFYHKNYIFEMIKLWESGSKPLLFGFEISIYYHLGLSKYKTIQHTGRASLYQTGFAKGFVMPENLPDKYFDIELWKRSENKKAFQTNKILSLGIKHGVGKCGGKGHVADFYSDAIFDHNNNFLKTVTDAESFYLHTIT